MSGNNSDEKKLPKLILTFTSTAECKVLIDQENITGPSMALNMLDMAKREFDFIWNVQRGMREQVAMEQQMRASQLIRKA